MANDLAKSKNIFINPANSFAERIYALGGGVEPTRRATFVKLYILGVQFTTSPRGRTQLCLHKQATNAGRGFIPLGKNSVSVAGVNIFSPLLGGGLGRGLNYAKH